MSSHSTARPHSTEAERTTLGALLIDPDKMLDVAPLLSHEDFYDPTHAAIFKAMQKLYEERRPIDFVTLAESLRENPAIERIGGSAFLASLAEDVPTASNTAHYAAIVREKSLKRKLRTMGTAMVQGAMAEDQSAGDVLETAERELLQLSRQSSQSTPTLLGDIAPERYDYYTALHEAKDTTPYRGIQTGFSTLDDKLVGLEPAHLMIVAGRPSMGKTAFALNVARNVAATGKSVSVFSLEMTKEQLTDRIIAAKLDVEASTLKRGLLSDEEFARMGQVIDGLEQQRIFIDDDPDTTLANLRSKARRQQMQHGLDLLIIDYLTLIDVTDRAANENQTQRITHISRSLKTLARELSCPIIALSQMNRMCENRNPPIPVLSDLRDSGSIEQDADTVLMLYRDDYYNEDSDRPGSVDLYLRKNRHGETGRVALHFDKQKMSFTLLSHAE